MYKKKLTTANFDFLVHTCILSISSFSMSSNWCSKKARHRNFVMYSSYTYVSSSSSFSYSSIKAGLKEKKVPLYIFLKLKKNVPNVSQSLQAFQISFQFPFLFLYFCVEVGLIRGNIINFIIDIFNIFFHIFNSVFDDRFNFRNFKLSR